MNQFGLIGKTLSHSFSRSYFQKKFEELKLKDYSYDLFELDRIQDIKSLLLNKNLKGLNVTVPYKQEVIPYLDELDDSAKKVGAVNVIKIINDRCIGYNSDYFGFKISLVNWLPSHQRFEALVLGSGGASKAVTAALADLDIKYTVASRAPQNKEVTYNTISQEFNANLIINTTPLGMTPNTSTFPPINYNLLTSSHFLYDLVYNPEETLFLSKGLAHGAHIKNGLEMLHLQAEESWKIWNE